jgi:hypothetical protein
MANLPQNYENHRRIVPLYLSVLGVLGVHAGWTVWRMSRSFSADTAMAALVAAALLVLAVYVRRFALVVQDRVIRLEMRLRLREVLPADQHLRIDDFTKEQLIALRFASDAELPALVETLLRDDVRDARAIKRMVKDWQPDHFRV